MITFRLLSRGGTQRGETTIEIGGKFHHRYRIKAELGEGGMGKVYFALDHDVSDRPVALKVIRRDRLRTEPSRPETADPEVSSYLHELLEQEARAMARVTHPGVVHLLDYHARSDDGLPAYMVTEYVAGTELIYPRHRAGMSSTERWQAAVPFISLIDQLLEIVGCFHAEGVIHGDLKPSNVLVQETYGGGQLVRVLDFGIARIRKNPREDEKGVTRISFTLDNASPEQLAFRALNPETDQYAIGLMLYRGLCGEESMKVEPGQSITEAIKEASELRTEPPEVCSSVPPEIVQVIRTALAPDPDQRYADIVTLRSELQEAVYAVTKDRSMPFISRIQWPLSQMRDMGEPAEHIADTRDLTRPAPVQLGTCLVVHDPSGPDDLADVRRDALQDVSCPEPNTPLVIEPLDARELTPEALSPAQTQALEYARVIIWDVAALQSEGAVNLHRLFSHLGTSVHVRWAEGEAPLTLAHLPVLECGPDKLASETARGLQRTVTRPLGDRRWVPHPLARQWRTRSVTTPLLVEAYRHVAEGRVEDADRAFEGLVDASPGNPSFRFRWLLLRSWHAQRAGDWREIVGQLEAVTDAAHELAAAWHLRGLACSRVNEDEQAMRYLEQALSTDRDNLEIWSAMGGVCKRRAARLARRSEHYQREAITNYTAAAEISRGHPYPLLNAIRLQAVQDGELSVADRRADLLLIVDERQQQVAQGIDEPWCHLDLAEALLYLGRPGDAGRALEAGGQGGGYSPWKLETFADSLSAVGAAHRRGTAG